MRALLLYSMLSLALVAAGGWVLGLLFAAPAEQRAIWISGGVALAVQLPAFLIARGMRRAHLIVGWALGALLSVGTLIIYAFVAQAQALPLAAALLSLATFLFVTELVEPLFLGL